jgi:hypothetical protein
MTEKPLLKSKGFLWYPQAKAKVYAVRLNGGGN